MSRPDTSTRLIHAYVAGPMFEDRPATIRQLRLGDQLALVRQPDNAVDVHAIRLHTRDGSLVGFIPRQMAAWLAPFIDARAARLVAEVTELHSDIITGSLRVQVAFAVPEVWTELATADQPVTPTTIEYTVEGNDLGLYVLATCDAERLVMVNDILQANGLQVVRIGYSTWQAKNGRLYEWYLKLGKDTGRSVEQVQQLLRSRLKGLATESAPSAFGRVTQEMRAEVARLQQEHAKALQDANAAIALGSEQEQAKQAEVDALQSNIERMEMQIAQLEHAKFAAEQKADVSGRALSARSARHSAISEEAVEVLQESIAPYLNPHSILLLVSALAPQHVEVLDSARKSAKRVTRFAQPKRLFELLWRLTHDYPALLIAGKGHADVVALFGNAYAAHESESTEGNADCRRARTFVYDGVAVEMMQHLKVGVGLSDEQCLRVHFAWDTTQAKVIIGHCGEHLPTAGC